MIHRSLPPPKILGQKAIKQPQRWLQWTTNEKAKDKIIWKGHEIKLEEVIGILQTEDSTQTLQEMNSETKNLHYAS